MATTRQLANIRSGDVLGRASSKLFERAAATSKFQKDKFNQMAINEAIASAQKKASAGGTGLGSTIGAVLAGMFTGGASTAAQVGWGLAGAGIGGGGERLIAQKDWDKNLKKVIKQTGGEFGAAGRSALSQIGGARQSSLMTNLITDIAMQKFLPVKAPAGATFKAKLKNTGLGKFLARTPGEPWRPFMSKEAVKSLKEGKAYKDWVAGGRKVGPKKFPKMQRSLAKGQIPFDLKKGFRFRDNFGFPGKSLLFPQLDVDKTSKIAKLLGDSDGKGLFGTPEQVADFLSEKSILANILRRKALTPFLSKTIGGYDL